MMVAPALIILSVFVIYPMVYTIYLSLFKWNLVAPRKFVGLDNFVNMFQSPDFWRTFSNTLYYMFFTVLFSIGLSLLLALYLRGSGFVKRVLQSVAFVPYITAMVSVAFIWKWMMNADYGLLNFLLGIFNISPVRWLEDPRVAKNSLVLVSVWKSLGYNTIILISAMQAVPKPLYEAASLDRGTSMNVFFRITLPMISPTLFFITLMDVISCFKVFETVNIMTHGSSATTTLVYDIYQYGFKYYNIGYASALGVVSIAFIGICTILYFKALSSRVHYR